MKADEAAPEMTDKYLLLTKYRMKKQLFKKLLVCLMSCLAVSTSVQAQQKGSNVVYQDDHVRITLITPGAARLEYAPQGKFVDDYSQIAVNRSYAPVWNKVSQNSKTLKISTSEMVITYKKGTGKFTADNLAITSANKKDKNHFTWHPGQKDDANLKGTYRTLDNYDGNTNDGKPMPIEDGLISRSGWTFIDDSHSYLFDHSEWPWVAERSSASDEQDWYFLAYGHNYKQALKDFTVFSGKVPLPPKYAFGYWWSRYWSYSDDEMRELVKNFHDYNIPLDVLVVDMDWHYNKPPRGGWTGYTWNKTLFPSPEGFIHWVKDQGLKVTMNLHPADGIKTWEERWPQMAQYMNMDTAQRKDIPYEGSNKRFMSGLLETQLKPMEKAGVDFWWIDWQQWRNDRKFKDLSNTWWINYVFFSNMERTRNTRPMLYHRWGGLGNHRYQIGFSGDAAISWKMLDFETYFNSTASNVLYSYWSHDIGGHNKANHIDPELYTRWMQFGLFSPILRTHSTKDSRLNKEPWAFSYEYTSILRDIVKKRYELVPYIYTMARKTYDDALPLCRPMYYDYPEAAEAYAEKNEYMFGDDILVYPVTAPMTDGKAEKTVWLPAGTDWYELSSGTLLQGGQKVKRGFHIDEMPVYVKAGSIIPLYGDTLKNLNGKNNDVTFAIYPSKGGTAHATLYEDEGNDKDYADHYATTAISSNREGRTLTVNIAARKGSYEGMSPRRHYLVKLEASTVPDNVKVNGRDVKFTYDGMTLSALIDLGQVDCSQPQAIVITYPDEQQCEADGVLGQMKRIRQNVYKLKVDNAFIVLSDELADMESTGRAITYEPANFKKLMDAFKSNFKNLSGILDKQQLKPEKKDAFLKAIY
jgi:alpha-glucosidase (family GH31 glycosyl hydrolase)